MRIKLKRFNFFILSVSLITGVFIVGWALASHFDNKEKTVASQKEMKNDVQAANVAPLALDHNNIIWVLVCAGLVGIFGVRRQSKTFVKADYRAVLEKPVSIHPSSRVESQASPIQPEKTRACPIRSPWR
jgi:hypothetical protein